MAPAAKSDTAASPKNAADDLFGANGLLARTEAKLLQEFAARPDDPRTLLKLATVRRRRGNIAAARENCERIIALQPDHALASWTSAVLSGADLNATPTPKGNVPAPFDRRQGFLTKQECAKLLRLATRNQDRFEPARVTGCDLPEGEVRPGTRRATVASGKVLEDRLAWFKPKLASAAAAALRRLPVTDMASHEIELNMTAHGDGDFFRLHQDNSSANHAGRKLSFVYYLHSQPRRFSGGDLLLYDTNRQADRFEMGVFTRIEPLHNSIVFFPSDCFHEITPVSGAEDFADSRFTVNGWFTLPKNENAHQTRRTNRALK